MTFLANLCEANIYYQSVSQAVRLWCHLYIGFSLGRIEPYYILYKTAFNVFPPSLTTELTNLGGQCRYGMT